MTPEEIAEANQIVANGMLHARALPLLQSALLSLVPPAGQEPIWLSVMRMSEGLEEIPGSKSNPVILGWARAIGAPSWFNNDDQAYCAVGANRSLMASHLPLARHPDSAKRDGYDLLRAATFEHYGTALTVPTLGCILVFRRPEGYHVGFYLGESADALYVYGANQKNTVCATWIGRDRLTAMRWPPGVPLVSTGPILLDRFGFSLSTNER